MHEPRDAPEPPEAPEDSFAQRTMMAWTPVCSSGKRQDIISRALEAHENASTATHKTLRPHLQGLAFQFNEWPLLSQAFDTTTITTPISQFCCAQLGSKTMSELRSPPAPLGWRAPLNPVNARQWPTLSLVLILILIPKPVGVPAIGDAVGWP